ncbi:MAG: peptidoglycan-associated lipoprotein Pal [Myxococcales bacterium]|nr:peptidoglycan-associated lipoprotein Pal [Myxococcales bacterium]MCB9550406.1 peptidoglycan-associated lipoprotein Pal [Myxococcales bacterium]
MNPTRRLLFAMVMGGATLVVAGCGPTYPKCENDGHCRDKGEYCLNGTCQQCRDNSHCEGPGMMCAAGSCQRQPGYCDDTVKCPGNQKCRDNQCGPQCLGNDECGAGEYCESGTCTQKPECGPNSDTPNCPEGQECVGGTCQAKVVECTAEPVYFDFDRSNIKTGQRAKLDQVAQCLNGDPNASMVVLAGHADERGTEEYNLALGERRAEAARRYLTSKGVAGNRLDTISYGESRPAVNGSNESAWAKNRRVEFNAR